MLNVHEIRARLLRNLRHEMRPYEVIDFDLDAKAHTFYSAVQFPEGVYAVAGFYAKLGYDYYPFDAVDETVGFSRRGTCPMHILRKLSPCDAVNHPDDAKWRIRCLKRILRSRTESEQDKADARKMLADMDVRA